MPVLNGDSAAAQPTVIYRPWGQVIDQESPTPVESLVTVGYIHYGTVAADFHENLVNLILYERDRGRHLDSTTNARGAYIGQLRNEVVKTFLAKRKAHWLLFLDNDMTFAPDTITGLLHLIDEADEGIKILSALYLTPLQRYQISDNQPEMLPAWGARRGEQDFTLVDTVDFAQTFMELQWCGMGCTLIHRDVLEAVGEAYQGIDEWPWFAYDQIVINGQAKRCGEDVTFCYRAAQLGFKIYGTPKITCGHIKHHIIHPISYAMERQNPMVRSLG
jgi:hypothetical protein